MKFTLAHLTIGSICLLSIMTSTPETEKITLDDGTKVIFVYPDVSFNNNNSLDANTNVEAKQDSTLTSIQTNTQIATLFSQAKEKYHGIISSLTTWIKQHKLRCFFGCVASVYLFANALLLHYHHYLNNKTTWAVWKKQLSNSELFALSQDSLQEMLLADIQQMYINQQNPTDSSYALTMFIKGIEQEITTLQHYAYYLKYAEKIPIKRCIFIKDKHEEIQSLIDRLLFIRHIFTSWLSTINLSHL